MTKWEKIRERLYEHKFEVEDKLKESGYIEGEHYIFESISLQGSQNYRTDTENSDVDSKYSLVPTVKSMLRGTDFTRDLTVSKNEKVSVKSFPDFVNLFFKGNVNNLEMLFTDYIVCNHNLGLMYNPRPIREDIVKATFGTVMSAMVGMAIQKQKSMLKGTETTKPFVEKLGYDPKDCAHILRLNVMLRKLVDGSKFEDALIMDDSYIRMRDAMYTGGVPLEGMQNFVNSWIASMKAYEEDAKRTMFNHGGKIQKLKESIAQNYEDAYDEYLREEVYDCTYCK